jgi:hypothetical protein
VAQYKPITNTAWVRARLCKLQKGCTRLAATSDKVYQLFAHGRWFSPGTPASSTTQTVRHDIAEILLKVALKHKKSNQTKHIQDRKNALLYLKHILLLESKWIRHTYFNFIEMYPKKCILHRCIG